MTCETVYEAVLAYLRKDKRGLALNIDEFNVHGTMVDKRILMAFCSRFEDDIEISSHMGFLKVFDYPIGLTAGVGLLPENYFRIMGDPYYLDTNGVVIHIDVVTSKEYTYRQRDYLRQATLIDPICVIGSQDAQRNMEIRVYPNTISTIYINYVRDTISPYLDYFINEATLQVTYLAQGLQNFLIPTGCVYRDGTTGIKNSLSVDYEWDDHEKPWIVAYFLQALGATIPDEVLLQVGKMDSAEIQNKPLW
jgi:hypothetical protein